MYSSAPAPIDLRLEPVAAGRPSRHDWTTGACSRCRTLDQVPADAWRRTAPGKVLSTWALLAPGWHPAEHELGLGRARASSPRLPPTRRLCASMPPCSPGAPVTLPSIVNRFSSWILHSPFARLLLLLLPSHPPHSPLSISSLSSLPPSRPPPAVLFSLVVFQPRSSSLSPSLISIASRILARRDFVPAATFTSASTSGSESSSWTSPKFSDSQSKRRRRKKRRSLIDWERKAKKLGIFVFTRTIRIFFGKATPTLKQAQQQATATHSYMCIILSVGLVLRR